MKKLMICIPTFKRLDKQTTWDCLPPKAREFAFLFCPPEEVKEHEARGRKVIVCPARGIAPKRDWIISYAYYNGIKKIVMFDDDIKAQRRAPDGYHIRDSSDKEIMQGLDWLEKTLDQVVHCSWSTRFLKFATPGEYVANRAMHCLAYRTDIIDGLGFSFVGNVSRPECFTLEDMYMTIQLFLAGYPNRVSLEWRLRTMGSNAKGGVSTWRTAKQQTENSQWLAATYPEVVKLRTKEAWPGMEAAEMLDVRVNWLKALKIGATKRVVK